QYGLHLVENAAGFTFDDGLQCFRTTLVGHMHHVEAGLGVELFKCQLRARAYAGGGEVILAGIRLHFSDEFFHRVHVDHIGVDRQDVGDIHQRGDGREVLFDVEGQFLVDGGIDPMSGGCTAKQGVAVRIGTCPGGGGQVAACGGAVINEDGG